MAGPSKKGENTKKAAGNAKKADAAAQKQAAADAKNEQLETEKWQKGAKDSSKKEAEAEKQREAARKREEKKALEEAEMANAPSKPKGAGAKTAQKKGAGTLRAAPLDLSGLDGEPSSKKSALNATGIDDALDALSLTNKSGGNSKIDRHPERRFKAAYNAYEERRLEEMKDEKGLRRQQKIDQIRKEFEKHPDNPFNQEMIGRFDMSKEEIAALREGNTAAKEARLGSPS